LHSFDTVIGHDPSIPEKKNVFLFSRIPPPTTEKMRALPLVFQKEKKVSVIFVCQKLT
jgi:hypothetical protein